MPNQVIDPAHYKSVLHEISFGILPQAPLCAFIGHKWKKCFRATKPGFWLIRNRWNGEMRRMAQDVSVVWVERGEKCTRCGARKPLPLSFGPTGPVDVAL